MLPVLEKGAFIKAFTLSCLWIFFTYNQALGNRTGYSWSPLTKDAGAKIDAGGLYYLMTNATDEVDSIASKIMVNQKNFFWICTTRNLTVEIIINE